MFIVNDFGVVNNPEACLCLYGAVFCPHILLSGTSITVFARENHDMEEANRKTVKVQNPHMNRQDWLKNLPIQWAEPFVFEFIQWLG